MFNPAVSKLTAPPVSVVQDWRTAYDGGCGNLIDMSQAVPGYAAHPDMTAALENAAADQNSARYGQVEGDWDLRLAYAAHLGIVYGHDIVPEETHITSGCNQAFVAAALAVAGHGDKILMTRPCYFNHESALGMLAIGIGYVDCYADNGMLPRLEDVEAAISTTTRAVAIVSPNNPCGAIYPPDLLDGIYELCRAKGIWLILDETYRDFLPLDATSPHDLFRHEGWQQTLVQLYSFSKSYCMPGHRLGAVTAGASFVLELAKIMDNIQICAPRVAQMAVTPMLTALTEWRQANRERIAARATLFEEVIRSLDGWDLLSTGAYFGYVRHPQAGSEASLEIAKRLACEVGVLTIPGTFFGDGQDAFLRFAFANAGRDVIAELPDRLAGF